MTKLQFASSLQAVSRRAIATEKICNASSTLASIVKPSDVASRIHISGPVRGAALAATAVVVSNKSPTLGESINGRAARENAMLIGGGWALVAGAALAVSALGNVPQPTYVTAAELALIGVGSSAFKSAIAPDNRSSKQVEV